MRAGAAVLAFLAVALAAVGARAEPAESAALAELASFVVGAPLDDATRGRLSKIAADEAKRDPAAAEKAQVDLEALLPKIRALKDEPARAAARGLIVAALYWRSREKPDAATALILEQARVAAADPQTRALVRQADLDGFCRSARLAADALPTAFDGDGCERAAREAAARLGSFSPADREMIGGGERRAAALADHWISLNQSRREALLEAAKKSAGTDDPIRLARPLETAALLARLESRLDRFGDAAADGLVSGATSSAIGSAVRGF